MPPQQPNQFDFIMDPNQGRKSGPSFLQNPKQRLITMVLFVAIVIIVVIIGASTLLSLGKQDNNDLVTVVAWQTELARISDIGLKEAKGTQARSLAATMQSFISSDVAAAKTYLSKNGTKLSEQQLASKRSTQRTEKLEEAAQRNTYDDTFITVLDELSAEYKRSLQAALNNTSGKNRQALLDTAAQNILAFEGE